MVRTGVLKSVTSKLRCAAIGNWLFFSKITKLLARCLISGVPR